MAAPSPRGGGLGLVLLALACWAAAVMAAAGVAGGPWGLGVPASHHPTAASKSSAWRGAFGLGGKRSTLQRYARVYVGPRRRYSKVS